MFVSFGSDLAQLFSFTCEWAVNDWMSNSLHLFCPNRKPFAIPSYFHSHLIYAEQKWKNHAYYAVSVIFELLLCTVEKLHTSWITHSPFILFKTQWGFEADKNREMWWYLSIREATLSCMLILTHTHTHTPGPSPQKQRSFCQELTVAVCLRMVRDWHWELGECFSHGAVCVKACFQYAKRVRARGRAGEVQRAYSWYFVNTLVRVRWVIVM